MPKSPNYPLIIGQAAESLGSGYMTFVAALTVASDPRALALAPTTNPGFIVPTGAVSRKDGTEHTYNFRHYLAQAATNSALIEEFKKVWLGGAILNLGDALAAHKFFDHAPEIEMIYHLRNGIAHGNKFKFDDGGRRRLKTYPANNSFAFIKGDQSAAFAISTSLAGATVLFDFMEAGDVLDLLMSVGLYLIRMGNGDPLRP
jgi:hypothetical protein